MEEGVYLLNLELKNVSCFGEKAILDLSNGKGGWENWTVILGNNGTGKTSLLKIIAGLECEEDTRNGKQWASSRSFFVHYNIGKSLYKVGTKELNVKGLFFETTGHNYDITFQYFQDKFYGFDPIDFQDNLPTIYGYGATRFMSRNSLTESKLENSATLFDDDAKLINAEEWLLQLHLSASVESLVKDLSIKRRDLVRKTLLNILPEDGVIDIQFTEPTIENQKVTLEFKTPYGWVTIHQLSLGYKTMVAWIIDLSKHMFDRYSKSPNPLAEPAIVLVDEIDLHMHPKWQRKIFDYLSERFPKTQFIVTAHSPLIVQSAPKDANIVLLRREGDHVVIDNDIQSVHNWRIDQILNSDLFGNISQRSPETDEWMNERKVLIQKGNRTDEEDQRLKELNKMAHELPTADNPRDIEAMKIIREAANYLKTQNA